MKFKKPFIIAVLLFQLLQLTVAHAQNAIQCPLINPQLTNLRMSSAKLAKTIVLSTKCQKYQETVNSLAKDLSNTVGSIDVAIANGAMTTPNPTTNSQNAQLASMAVLQLNQVQRMFNNRDCGGEVLTFLDFSEAFVDTVLGISPFLALYGGSDASPWVLSTALGASALKILITYLQSIKIDMRDPDQSNAFLKNSCSFYILNQVKKSLETVEATRLPKIKNDILEVQKKLKEVQAKEPLQPNSDMSADLNLAQKDKAWLDYIQKKWDTDPREACVYISMHAQKKEEASGTSPELIDRLVNQYVHYSDPKTPGINAEPAYFKQNLSDLFLNLNNKDKDFCIDASRRWLNKAKEFNAANIKNLSLQLSKNDIFINYKSWNDKVSTLQSHLSVLEKRWSFMTSLVESPGYTIEFSEITRNYDKTATTLFDTRRAIVVNIKGLAGSWLKVKIEDAKLKIEDFKERQVHIFDLFSKIRTELKLSTQTALNRDHILQFASSYQDKNKHEHKIINKGLASDICSMLNKTWQVWFDGLNHSRAGRDYCMAFSDVIDPKTYPDVHAQCFDVESKHSLKSLVQSIEGEKKSADIILELMNDFQCKKSPDLDPNIFANEI
jgi:hypothetical protein